jgi:hypothetical protein
MKTFKEIYEIIAYPFVEIKYWVSWKYRLFKHYVRWAKRIGKINNFSGYEIFKLMEYQLKDVQYSMINGYIDWTDSPEDLKSIRLAIKLSKRLGEDYSSTAAYERFDKKWPLKDESVENMFKRIRSQGEKNDLAIWHIEEERQQKRDLRNLTDLIKKYVDRWLD